MRPIDLPKRWQVKLRSYLISKGSKHQTLSVSDFPTDGIVRIIFEDDSKVEFRYAFVIKAPDLRELAVFTEHCGHHLFPFYEGIDLVIESSRDASLRSA